MSSAPDGSASLAENVGEFAERFMVMTNDAEEMAKQLEDRMSYLQESYDHLNNVSAQVPEAIADMASQYKSGILEGADMNILNKQEKEELNKHGQTIDFLRCYCLRVNFNFYPRNQFKITSFYWSLKNA